MCKFALFVSLTISVFACQRASFAGDGCTLPFLPDFTGRVAVQEALNVIFADACGRHDDCYQSCGGKLIYGSFELHKQACDLSWLWEMQAWCGAATTLQAVTDQGFDPVEFEVACAGGMYAVYQFGLRGSAGLSAYVNDQCGLCDEPYIVLCLPALGNGACSYFGVSVPAFCGPSCTPDPEARALCRDAGGSWSASTCSCIYPGSPILVDLDGRGFRLTSPGSGVSFDIDGEGDNEWCAWTAPGELDAFLALDRDGNGRIDSGQELFGDHTAQQDSPQPNGFKALSEYDAPTQGGNADGWIDRNDRIFEDLRLWIDSNHDGRSQPAELFSLAYWDIVSIDLDYRISRRQDRHGNVFRYASRVYLRSGKSKLCADVYFKLWDPAGTSE